MVRSYLSASALAAAAAVGCTANVGAPQSLEATAGASGSASGSVDQPPAQPSEWKPGLSGDAQAAGLMPLRQLNRVEYRNAAVELFGNSQHVDELLPGDVAGSSGFATAGLASEVTVQALQQAAEKLASTVNVQELTGCDTNGAGEAACIESLLASFGARAYRRPLSPAELSEYQTLYGSLRSEVGMGFEAAARTVVEALLQSPGFLYHWELGPRAPLPDVEGVIKLGGYELASRLSFLLWSSIPDADLLAAAASGGLDSPEGIETQARRLLASDKALATMRNFHLQWLEVALAGVNKSAEIYPSFTPALAAAMEDELAFFSNDLYQGGGTAGDLFQAMTAPASPALATLYGSSARPGVLTRAGFLTATSNAYEGDPTKRGAVIRTRVLCDTLVPPPANIPPLPAASPNQTVRERHAMHMSVEPCQSCHRMTDPIGFGLGNFDAMGGYQAQDSGKPIDTAGSVVDLDGSEQTFADAAELMALLANSQDVRACLTKQWLRFGFSRAETVADDASLESAYQSFAQSGFQLSELLIGLTRARSFRFRAVSPGEVLQ